MSSNEPGLCAAKDLLPKRRFDNDVAFTDLFTGTIAHTVRDGKSNIRDILVIKRVFSV